MLKNQIYEGKLEFILCDDNSKDRTKEIIYSAMKSDPRIKYVHSKAGDPNLSFKKRNLDAGINIASNDIMLFTDMDCIIQPLWVKSMSKYFTDGVDYVVGFSKATNPKTLAARFQKFDFFMLFAGARAMINNNSPWACSGQNQGYRKSLFNSVNGFNSLIGKLQGDDSLFLQICRNKKKTNVKFAYDDKAHVVCRSENKWLPLIKQRIRWSGDGNIMWQYNKIFYICLLSMFLANTGFIFLPFFAESISIVLVLLFLKYLFEYLLFTIANREYKNQLKFYHFNEWFALQIPFVFIMGIGSFFANNISWRGKHLKKC